MPSDDSNQSFLFLQNEEIFRDYGFVESFPQRWTFMADEIEFDLVVEVSVVKLVWLKEHSPANSVKTGYETRFRKELKRLQKFRNTMWNSQLEFKYDIPEYEWGMIWEFHAALTNALSYAINEMVEDEKAKVPILGSFTDGVCEGR
jgi:hypothetical protein